MSQKAHGDPSVAGMQESQGIEAVEVAPLQRKAPNKGKGIIEPPITSSMVATPSGMVPSTSNVMPTSSFVIESSLGREAWERRPLTRSVGK